MSSKFLYHPFKTQDGLSIDEAKPKMSRILRYPPQAQDSKQAIKKKIPDSP